MTVETEQKAAQIAEEFIKAQEAAKAETLTDEQKEEAAKAQADADAKAKAEAEAAQKHEETIETLIEKPEAELTEEDKKLLEAELAEEQNLDEKTRMEKGLKKSRKRIDRLTAKLREAEDERSVLAEGYKQMKAEIEALKASVGKPKEAPKDDVAKILNQAIQTALAEDAELPREQRREMDNDELREWFADDPVAAQEWIAQREVRRTELKYQLQGQTKQNVNAEQFIAKQKQSVDKFVSEFPNAKPDAERAALLAGGKTMEETQEILEKKYPEFKLANAIVDEAIAAQREGRESMLAKENFGELLAAELKKRMEKGGTASGKTKSVYTEEEVQQKIKEAQEMERQRLERARGASSGSSSVSGVPAVGARKLSEDEEFLTRHGQKAGLSPERIKKILDRHNDRVRNGLRQQGKDPDSE